MSTNKNKLTYTERVPWTLMTGPLPVAVFAAAGQDPELHVDARYLAYALDRFAGCSFWRALHDAFVAVRDQQTQAIVGITRRASRGRGGRHEEATCSAGNAGSAARPAGR